MQTTADIIAALGGPTEVAEALGRPVGTVTAWPHRGRIPPKYWPELIEIARQKRVRLTVKHLSDAFLIGRTESA